MPNIIQNNAIILDTFTQINTDTNLEALSGNIIVPLAIWEANQSLFATHTGQVGLYIENSVDIEALEIDLNQFSLIALNFPEFVDGRAYSQARIIRTRINYKGALRATGDVLHDQLFFMQRCGFNEYAVREDKNMEVALEGLSDFSVKYQSATDESKPLFARVYN